MPRLVAQPMLPLLALAALLAGLGPARAGDGLVSTWSFDGVLTDPAGQSRDDFSAQGGTARFVSATDLPGADGQAVAVGIEPGDAQYFTAPASVDTRLGPPYTIEIWLHPTAVSPEWDRLFLNWTAEHAYHVAIHRGMASLYHAQADRRERVSEGGQMRPHRWYCLTAVASRREDAPQASTTAVYLNGRQVGTTTFDGTISPTTTPTIGLADSADGSGASIRFHGYVDAVTVWDRALAPQETAARCAARQATLDLPSREVTIVREALQRSAFEGAVALERRARGFQLTDELAEVAGDLLRHEDVFVRALAEWALARRIGYDNSWGTVVWTGSEPVEWLQRWQSIPREAFVELDWIRHAHARGILTAPDRLRQETETLSVRAAGTAAAIQPAARGRFAGTLAAVQASARTAQATDDLPALRQLWLSARRALRPLVFARAELDFDRLVFYTRYAPHHKPNVCGVHSNWAYKPGGDIEVLDGLAGSAEPALLIRGRLGAGHVHGLDLWFDAERVVFGWARQPNWPPRRPDGTPYDLCHVQNNYAYELLGQTEPLHLYEATVDGTRVTQLTDHDTWSDLEPAYLADGAIVFSSDRSAHSPSCDGWENDITDLNLYRLGADRRTIRRLANHKDIDMHPHLLDNGLIAYLRWEYQERDFWDTHSVWTMRPDGTMPDALFKQHLPYPTSVREARSVPGTTSLVAIAAGHHCYPVGPIVRLNPGEGMNHPESIDIVAMGSPPQERAMAGSSVPEGGVRDAEGYYGTPYALSKDCYLASFGFGSGSRLSGKSHGQADWLANDAAIYVLDTLGNKELLVRDRFRCAVSPLPLRPRPRPPVLPDATDDSRNDATCIVPDVYEGLTDVERGTVTHIRILEALPWPLTPKEGSRYYGGQSFNWQVAQERNWNPIRVIGTVPVAADGSAHFRVPTVSNASVAFQALDAKGRSVQRMRSSVSFQPGEVRSCNGCHETRTAAPAHTQGIASTRPPDTPRPPSWGVRPLGYEWLVQPVLTKHCAGCHGGEKPKADLDLSDTKRTQFGLDSMLSSYFAILNRKLVACTNQRLDGAVTTPRQFGALPSRLIEHLVGNKEHAKLALSDDEWEHLVTWVDSNCPYHDQLYNKRPADGGKPRREPFPWRDPWATSEEWPAKVGSR